MKRALVFFIVGMVCIFGIPVAVGANPLYDIFYKVFLEHGPLLHFAEILLLILAGVMFHNSRRMKAKNAEVSNLNYLFKTFIDASDSMIYLKDQDLKYLFVNKAVEDFYQMDATEIVGADDFALTKKDFADLRKGTDLKVLAEQITSIDVQSWADTVIQKVKFPVELPEGKVGVGAYVTDITEEYNNRIELEELNKQLHENQYLLEEQNATVEELNSQLEEENERYQQQKETLQAIVDSLGAGIVMTDLKGRIVFVNDAWIDLFDYLDFNRSTCSKGNFYIDNNASFGTKLFLSNMLTGIVDKDAIFNKLTGLLHDTTSRYSVDMEQVSPVKRFLQLYSNPCISYEGHTFGRIFAVRDVSSQKEVENLKLELISTVSHELRTPMSSILGFSELLYTRKLAKERYQEYIGIINSEAKRLTHLIDDFLDIQRMESRKYSLDKQVNSLDQLIVEAIKLFDDAKTKHQIVYSKDEGLNPIIYCDRDKILQVLANLLSNAIKYSPGGGKIVVSLTMEKDRLVVSVSDHGLGIPNEVQHKLFGKFFRVQTEEHRRVEGTGLGLAICQEIIKAHRGEIGVTSTYGLGSTFYFSLPQAAFLEHRVGIGKPDKLTSEQDALGKPRILIVEDDAAMVTFIKEALEDEGLVMGTSCSGEEALNLAGKHTYRLFIVDIVLSGELNGWELIKALKGNPKTTQVPIIISSAYENKQSTSISGISDYLVKPFSARQLVKVVRKALNGCLDSMVLVNGEEKLKKDITLVLKSKGINIQSIERRGNILLIALNEEEGL
jgi:signal transduction histidine kinase/DNA-binding NarL/FixJ family response regulator